jgi:hypothetical protein
VQDVAAVQHLLETLGHDVADFERGLDDRGRRTHVLHLDLERQHTRGEQEGHDECANSAHADA